MKNHMTSNENHMTSNENHMTSKRVKTYYFIIKMHNLCHNFKPNDKSPAYMYICIPFIIVMVRVFFVLFLGVNSIH